MSMRLLVCSDIFGVTNALYEQVSQITDDYLLLAPASAESAAGSSSCLFADDQVAYQAFLAAGGLAIYQQKVAAALQVYQPSHLLGFSAGAAALWQSASDAHLVGNVQQGLLCYGGQIRHLTELTPKCALTLLWADESHFCVEALSQQLASQLEPQLAPQLDPNAAPVTQLHWAYGHGFINPCSKNYKAAAARLFWQQCGAMLSAKKP